MKGKSFNTRNCTCFSKKRPSEGIELVISLSTWIVLSSLIRYLRRFFLAYTCCQVCGIKNLPWKQSCITHGGMNPVLQTWTYGILLKIEFSFRPLESSLLAIASKSVLIIKVDSNYFNKVRSYNFVTHRIWQIRPLCPWSKWNMGEILEFLD